MPRQLRILLVALVAVALLVPATGAAQEPPPEESPPPPPPPTTTQPQEPVVEIEEPVVVTITVPPLPEPKPAARKAKPQQAASTPREPVRRSTPRRSEPSSSETPSEFEAPTEAAAPAKAKPAKPKPVRRKARRARPRVVAKAAPAPVQTIRDPDRAGAVLAAQFTLTEAAGEDYTPLVLALLFAFLLAAGAGVVYASPVLADRWPKVFVPVLESTDRIVVPGLCVAGAALTLVITWALTGPGS